jgi:hypothetical protein
MKRNYFESDAVSTLITVAICYTPVIMCRGGKIEEHKSQEAVPSTGR